MVKEAYSDRSEEDNEDLDLKEELKIEEDVDAEVNDGDVDIKSEESDDDSESGGDASILAYKFAEMISSGEIEKLAEEEFLSKKEIFPNFIEINQKAISEALANLKVQFLEEKYKSSQLVGKNKYKIGCGLCPYEKNQRSLMMKHLRSHFKNMFWCITCDKSVSTIKSHIQVWHSDKPDTVWVCEICNKSVKTEYNLTLHRRSHETVYCDQCDFNCEGRKRLQSHVYRKHMDSKESHVCHVCSKTVSTSQQLKSHLQIHGEEEFKCEYCDKMFKVEKNMQKHIIMHHKEKKFICEHCGMSFSVKCHHDKHVLIKHTKDKNFNCNTCEYKGATKYYLQKHMEIHEEAKHACPLCGKAFRQPGALKSHTMTHTGERPYACTDCSYRCIQPYDLRKHFLKQHNKVIEKPGLYKKD